MQLHTFAITDANNNNCRHGKSTQRRSSHTRTHMQTCDDECVGDGGLAEHPLHVSAEELERLATPTVRVHQDHRSAGSTHL